MSPLSEPDGKDALREHVRALQKEIGISEDFLENLYSEPDDWSFVVKLSALIEAAMTHLVTEAVGKPELRDAFASTDLAHTRAGKLVFASALGVLESDDKRLITKLAEMRNAFVHDVRRVRMTIPEYIASLDQGDRNGLLKAARYFAPEKFETIEVPEKGMVNVVAFVRDNPRLAIWFSAMNLVAVLYVHKTTVEERREVENRIRDANTAFASTLSGILTESVKINEDLKVVIEESKKPT